MVLLLMWCALQEAAQAGQTPPWSRLAVEHRSKMVQLPRIPMEGLGPGSKEWMQLRGPLLLLC